jgi:hypothetical protein
MVASSSSPAVPDEFSEVPACPKFRWFTASGLATEFIVGLSSGAVIVADPPSRPRCRDQAGDALTGV